MAHDSSIIFITGGVRSGKSSVCRKNSNGIGGRSLGNGQLHYIAAMQPSDSEMEKRICRHQEDRRQSGYYWQTWEQPVSIGRIGFQL